MRKLDRYENLLIEGMINKWRRKHNDRFAERIDFIYVDPSDVIPDESLSSRDIDKRDVKYSPLRKLTSRSRLYLIGHHEINDNRLEITSDPDIKNEGAVYHYDVLDVARLLARYLTDPSITRNRLGAIGGDFANAMRQSLMISVAMCNTAIGMLKDGDRKSEESLAGVLAETLYNQSDTSYLDCVVSGTTAWVSPTPGKPSFSNLLKLLFCNVNSLIYEPEFTNYAHKRYVENISFFGKFYESLIPRLNENGRYKRYFHMADSTTPHDIQARTIKLAVTEGVEWYRMRHSVNQDVDVKESQQQRLMLS